MAKSRGFWNVKRVVWFSLAGTAILFVLIRILNSTKTPDLQTILQNLPKEISQNINNANSKQQSDLDIIARFQELTEELLLKQEEQTKNLEKERRVLEKKINSLKQLPDDLTLREKLAYSFPYDPTSRFPAYIWQTWNDATNGLDYSINKQNWDDKNPGFVHEIFNDDFMEAMVRHFYSSIPEIIDAYNVLPSLILKIDYYKFLILFARGGVYADMDTVPIQPIPNWIPEALEPNEIGLIVCVEHDAKPGTAWKKNFVRRLQFGTWIIQSKPGHPVLREIVAQLTEITLRRKNENTLNVNLRNDINLMSWTGSGVWTDVIFTYFNDYIKSGVKGKTTWKEFHEIRRPKLVSDVLVLPQFSFDAPHVFEGDERKKQLYFAIHDSNKFWKGVPKVER